MIIKLLFFIICGIYSGVCIGQSPVNKQTQNAPKPEPAIDEKLFIFPEVPAVYPGGEAAFQKFLLEHLDPNVATSKKAPVGQYVIKVRCIVNQWGSVDAVMPESHIGYGIEQEAVRVIRLIKRWIPARQKGKPVNSMLSIPVRFSVPAL